jgi:hypothetical protein
LIPIPGSYSYRVFRTSLSRSTRARPVTAGAVVPRG